MKSNKEKSPFPRIVYFSDERNDEFSSAKITPKKIDGSYKYKRDKGVGRVICFFLYRIVATPLAFFYLKLKFRHKIVGKEKLKAVKKGQGFFVYANHTQAIADALIPSFVSFPHKAYVIVHANNVSMPVLGALTPYMGALPLPDTQSAARSFNLAVGERIEEGRAVFIYPEAHIWPYFTGIRNFSSESFYYPVKYSTPVFCFTNTYKKRRSNKRVKIVTYIDGPFYPDKDISPLEGRQVLRDRIYEAMKIRATSSDTVLVEYRKAEEA